MATAQWQRDACDVIRARLDPREPGHAASEEITAAFAGPARLYLETWVFPLLDALASGKPEHWQRDAIKRDAARVAIARDTAARSQEPHALDNPLADRRARLLLATRALSGLGDEEANRIKAALRDALAHAGDEATAGEVRDRRDGPARDTVAQGERASAPGYDPTCAMCASGEEPGHEH